MTEHDFIIWLKGFSKAANPYNVTPEQWRTITEELEKVNKISVSLGLTSNSTATTLPSSAVVSYTTDSKTILHD